MDFHKAYEASDANPHLPLFPQREVLAVLTIARAALSPTNLQNWTNRGLVKLTENNPGRAGRRLYSLADLVKLHLMVKLTSLTISASSAASISSQLADYVDEVLKIDADIREQLRTGNEKAALAKNASVIIWEENGELKSKLERDRYEFIKSLFGSMLIETITKGISEKDPKIGALISDNLPVPREPNPSIRISVTESVHDVKRAILEIVIAQADAVIKQSNAS
ncbi:DNA-binding transcriptional MerR regulator [Azospirillum agricola]|uniref:MerR family transcriptional regulator n=1 Tax=Azospirillum agricola TaxID=1720247 RepID=UPI001AE3BC98|nr:MerR family transcriptional regulator [Azospirillum agricola]MBP2227188.1 DNA-binding transcriptional MerR regulator [Azospirillum agricola]